MTLASRLAVLALLAAATITAPLANAQARTAVRVEAPAASVTLTFGASDVARIREFYASAPAKQKALPPGQQKKAEGRLPPGLQKRLDRGDALPPGLAKRSMPRDLETRLGTIPEGYARFVVGADVVLVDTRNVILDIVVGVAL